MPVYKKTVLLANKTYRSPDGDVLVTPDRLKHWESQFKSLTAAGYKVPIDWDHSDDPGKSKPIKSSDFSEAKRSAKNTVGHLADFRVSPDGMSAEVKLDLHRKSAVEAAKNNTVYVSPVIFDKITLGNSKELKDVITHVDFVQYPVDYSQSKFVPEGASIACAIRMGIGRKSRVFRLGEEVSEGEDKPADDKDSDDDLILDFSPDDKKAEGSDDASIATELSDALKACGIASPEGVDFIENPLEWGRQLAAILRQKQISDGDADASADGGDIGGDATAPDAVGDAAVPTPELAQMSMRLQAVHDYANGMYRSDLERRLKGLVDTGRCDPATAKKKKSEIVAVRLSIGGGSQKPAIEAWLDDRETLPPNSVSDASRRVLGIAVNQTAVPDGDDGSPEGAKAFVDQMAKRHPGMFK